MGWFVTLKKIGSKIWTWKKQVAKNRVIVIQKEKRQPGLFSFWITIFLHPAFFRSIFWTWFFSGSQTNPCFQNKNSGCRLTGRVSYIEDCLNFLTNCFGFQVMLSSFMGPYLLFYILILWIYPVKTYIGEFACYLMIYTRSVYVFTSNFYKTFYQILSSCFSGEIYKALYVYTFKIKLKKNHGKYFNHTARSDPIWFHIYLLVR